MGGAGQNDAGVPRHLLLDYVGQELVGFRFKALGHTGDRDAGRGLCRRFVAHLPDGKGGDRQQDQLRPGDGGQVQGDLHRGRDGHPRQQPLVLPVAVESLHLRLGIGPQMNGMAVVGTHDGQGTAKSPGAQDGNLH